MFGPRCPGGLALALLLIAPLVDAFLVHVPTLPLRHEGRTQQGRSCTSAPGAARNVPSMGLFDFLGPKQPNQPPQTIPAESEQQYAEQQYVDQQYAEQDYALDNNEVDAAEWAEPATSEFGLPVSFVEGMGNKMRVSYGKVVQSSFDAIQTARYYGARKLQVEFPIDLDDEGSTLVSRFEVPPTSSSLA
jgi:hypothetical protein